MSRDSTDTTEANDRRSRDTTRRSAAPVPLLRVANLGALAAVRHGFTTRHGGVSEGPWGSLNLARRAGESDEKLAQNWDAVVQTLDPSLDAAQVALLHQVHGAEAVRVDAPSGPLHPVGAADAAYTSVPGIVLAVRTADCVPVLVAGEHTVGVAHSGWRGTAAGVVPALVAALVEAGEQPGALVVAVGPAISYGAYEVGEEVVEGLRSAGLSDAAFQLGRDPTSGRFHVDLRAAVVAQLRACGVHDVEVLHDCTVRDTRLYSHRRDGADAGRQAAVIARFPWS